MSWIFSLTHFYNINIYQIGKKTGVCFIKVSFKQLQSCCVLYSLDFTWVEKNTDDTVVKQGVHLKMTDRQLLRLCDSMQHISSPVLIIGSLANHTHTLSWLSTKPKRVFDVLAARWLQNKLQNHLYNCFLFQCSLLPVVHLSWVNTPSHH